jgi:glycosyltransferase 2 family protein
VSRLARNRLLRGALVIPAAAAVALLFWWRGPNWGTVADAFGAVAWEWVAVAILLNLLSVIARSIAWMQVIDAAVERDCWPRFRHIFSAFSVGLMGNAILPGRVGELARVAVLVPKMPRRRGLWAALVGTVFAHRVFDIVPVMMLILYVALTAKVPSSATYGLVGFVAIGAVLFAIAFLSAKRHHRSKLEELGAFKRVVAMIRHGLAVMRVGPRAVAAVFFQILGWTFQLLAVYTAMQAFHIHAPLPAAGLVLVLMNVATIFPIWPGNVGIVQAAIAYPLTKYGVTYAHGVAFGFGLQAIEASVGVGVGLIFLMREGLSIASLRGLPSAADVDAVELAATAEEEDERARAGVPG